MYAECMNANCLAETCTKLEELIPAAMVKYGLTNVQLASFIHIVVGEHL